MRKTNFLFIFLFLIESVYGAKIAIVPTKIELKSYPGAVEDFAFTIQNRDKDKPLFCKVYTQDFAITEKGRLDFFEVGSASWSCAGWIKTDNKDVFFTIEPKGLEVIRGYLSIPKDAIGSYGGMVICEILPHPYQLKESQGGAFIHLKIPIPVYIDIGERIIEKIVIGTITSEKGLFTLSVENRGERNVVLQEGNLTIKTKAGGIIKEIPLKAERYTLLRDSSRIFKANLKDILPGGKYKMVAKVGYRGIGDEEPKEIFSTSEISLERGRISFEERKEEKKGIKALIIPSDITLALTQGRFKYDIIKIQNQETEEIFVKAKLSEISTDAEGEIVYPETETSYSLSSIIEVFPESLKIPEKQTGILKYKLAVPREEKGGKYGALILSLSTRGNRTDTRVIPLSLTIEKTEKAEVKVEELEVKSQSSIIKASFMVKNIGNVKEEEQGEVVIKDKNILHKIPFSFLLFPGEEKRITLSSPLVLKKARYTAEILIKEKPFQTTEFSVK